jgi:hypothetical protein
MEFPAANTGSAWLTGRWARTVLTIAALAASLVVTFAAWRFTLDW